MSLYTLFYVNQKLSAKSINALGEEFHISFLALERSLAEFEACFRVFWSGCDRGTFVFGKRDAPQPLAPQIKEVLERIFPDEPRESEETRVDAYLRKEEACERDRLGFLRAFFEAVPHARVGILQHWFSGAVEDELIEISAVESITLQTKPKQLKNDVLYVLGE